jgi:hypothetical protein
MPEGQDLERVIGCAVIDVIADSRKRNAAYILELWTTRPSAHAGLNSQKTEDAIEVVADGTRRVRPILRPPRCSFLDLCLSVPRDFDL